jgi:hypothetical protein
VTTATRPLEGVEIRPTRFGFVVWRDGEPGEVVYATIEAAIEAATHPERETSE